MTARRGCCCRNGANAKLFKFDGSTGDMIFARGYMIEPNPGESLTGIGECFVNVTGAYYEGTGNQLWLTCSSSSNFCKLLGIYKTGSFKFAVRDRLFSAGYNPAYQPIAIAGSGSISIVSSAIDGSGGLHPRRQVYDQTGAVVSTSTTDLSSSSISLANYASWLPGGNKVFKGSSTSIFSREDNGTINWGFTTLSGVSTGAGDIVGDDGTNFVGSLGVWVDPTNGHITGPVVGGGSGVAGSARNAVYAGPGCVVLTVNSGTVTQYDVMDLATANVITILTSAITMTGTRLWYRDGSDVYLVSSTTSALVNRFIAKFDNTGSLVWQTTLPTYYNQAPSFHNITVDDDSNVYFC